LVIHEFEIILLGWQDSFIRAATLRIKMAHFNLVVPKEVVLLGKQHNIIIIYKIDLLE